MPEYTGNTSLSLGLNSSIRYNRLEIEYYFGVDFNAAVTFNEFYIEISPELEISTLVGEIGNLDIYIPPLELVAYTAYKFEIEFPVLSLDISALVGEKASFEIKTPRLEIQVSAIPFESARLDLSLSIIQTEFLVSRIPYVNLSIRYPPATLFFIGKPGGIADISIDIRLPSLQFRGFTDTQAHFVLVCPHPLIFITSDQYYCKYYKTIVLNVSNYAVSEYLNFAFNSYAYFNGMWLGAKEDGIYELDGNKDEDVEIQARIKMPVIDMWKDFMKRAREAWLSGRFENQMILGVEVDEEIWEDIFDRDGDGDFQEMRCKLPKGFKERFLSFEIKNRGGADFDIDKLRIIIDGIKRRVR